MKCIVFFYCRQELMVQQQPYIKGPSLTYKWNYSQYLLCVIDSLRKVSFNLINIRYYKNICIVECLFSIKMWKLWNYGIFEYVKIYSRLCSWESGPEIGRFNFYPKIKFNNSIVPPKFSPTRPSGPSWSVSRNVCIFIGRQVCPLPMRFFSRPLIGPQIT